MNSHLGDAEDTGLDRDQAESNTLLTRLRVIEDQPLDQRAEAYAHIHETLRSTLEGGDAASRQA